MSADIFAALENRFNANSTLVTVGRKLYRGFEKERKNVVWPYTEVNYEKTARSLSTWDSDIDEWDLQFRLHSKDLRSISADLWLGAMRAMFKDSDLRSSVFQCAGVREGTMSSPMNRKAAFEAAIRFTMIVTWRQLSPLVRGV